MIGALNNMLKTSEQFWNQIKAAQAIALIIGPDFADDGLAAGIALKRITESLQIKTDLISIASENLLTETLKGEIEIASELNQPREFVISLSTANAQVDKVKYKMEADRLDFVILSKNGSFTDKEVSVRNSGHAYDLIITINLTDLASLGEIYTANTDLFYSVPIINIDNQMANENFGRLNLVDLTASSATEIIYQLCADQPELIHAEIATCLLAGIISRTKSYRSETVTPQALLATAELLKLGADRDVIIEKLYRNRSLATLQLWGKLLMSLESQVGERLLYTRMSETDLMQIDDTAISQILDELISLVPEALVLIIFFDQGNHTTLAVASPKNINCLSLLKEYQPTGAKDLVWLDLPSEIDAVQPEMIKLVSAKLEKIN